MLNAVDRDKGQRENRVMQTPIKHIRIPDELWNALERIGKEAGVERTTGWLVRKAIQEYIERHRASKRAAKATPASSAEESRQ
jgi:predicted transcriptional regulator